METQELKNQDNLSNYENTNDSLVNVADGKTTTTVKKPDNQKALLIILVGLFVCLVIAAIAAAIGIALSKVDNDEPRLIFHPNLDDTYSVIFEQGKPVAYDKYTKEMTKFLSSYDLETIHGENFVDCANFTERPADLVDLACVFNLGNIDRECNYFKEYGYDEGQPCVILMLEKIAGWNPVPYNKTMPPPADSGLQDNWDSHHIGVTCEGQTEADKENMGPIDLHPSSGFKSIYFPYKEKYAENYMSPLVMVKFKRPKNGVLIQVKCQAWAQNIDHTRGKGAVKFYLMID